MAFDDEDLELAFQLHVIEELLDSDFGTTALENQLVERWFPLEIRRSRGMVDDTGPTARYREAVEAAHARLPTRLDHARKLELLGCCYRIAVADREFRLGEGAVLLAAARALGLGDDDFDAFLHGRPGATGMTAAALSRF